MRLTTGNLKKAGAVSTLVLAAAALLMPAAPAHAAPIGTACVKKINAANSLNEQALKADRRGDTAQAARINRDTRTAITTATTTCRTSSHPEAVRTHLNAAKQNAERAEYYNKRGKGSAAIDAEQQVKIKLREASARA